MYNNLIKGHVHYVHTILNKGHLHVTMRKLLKAVCAHLVLKDRRHDSVLRPSARICRVKAACTILFKDHKGRIQVLLFKGHSHTGDMTNNVAL